MEYFSAEFDDHVDSISKQLFQILQPEFCILDFDDSLRLVYQRIQASSASERGIRRQIGSWQRRGLIVLRDIEARRPALNEQPFRFIQVIADNIELLMP